MLHAHIESYATDCDGPIERTYVIQMSEEEMSSEFGDIEFHDRVTASVVNTYGIFQSGRLEVTSGEGSEFNGAGFVVQLDWSEATEEGSRSVVATICKREECDLEDSTYRDITAERAGY